MVGISGIIKLLHSKHGNTFPITTTRAIYSENTGKCLDDILNDVMLSSAEDINAINNKIGNLDELTTTEKGSLVGAVTELNSQLKSITTESGGKTILLFGGRIAVVSLTLSSTADTLVSVERPSYFTIDNTMILGAMIDSKAVSGRKYSANVLSNLFNQDKIYASTQLSDCLGQTCRIVLMRTDSLVS